MEYSNSGLDSLYFTHPSGSNSGTYNQIEWSSRIEAATRSPQARIVTIHEMLHSELNNSTGFGTILIVLADLCKKFPEKNELRETLKKLVSRCRTVHEVFATTGSLMLLSEKSAWKDLLNFYPNYQRYHQIGLSLCHMFKGFTLRYNSMYVIIRACMHSNAIRSVIEIGLDNFKLKDLRIHDCPDNRLNILRFGLSEIFWEKAIERARTDCPDQEFWKHIEKEEVGIGSNIIASYPRFDSLVDNLIRSLYISCMEMLQEKGIKSLSFNGHQPYVELLLESAQKLYSQKQPLFPTLQVAQNEGIEELIVRNLENERLVLQEPCEGQLFRLDKISTEQWPSLVSGEVGNEHYFIGVRPALKLKTQYHFKIIEEQFLDEFGNAPLMFIRRSAIEPDTEKRIVQFFYVRSPDLLNLFFGKCLVGRQIFSNVSLSVYVNSEWKSKWNHILQAHSTQSLLIDISPTSVFKYWAKDDSSQVRYELINLHVDDRLRSVLVFDYKSGKWPLVIVPCTSVTADGLVMYIKSKQVPAQCYIHQKDTVTQNKILLSVILGHLFKEETWFDFQSAITKGTGEETDI